MGAFPRPIAELQGGPYLGGGGGAKVGKCFPIGGGKHGIFGVFLGREQLGDRGVLGNRGTENMKERKAAV